MRSRRPIVIACVIAAVVGLTAAFAITRIRESAATAANPTAAARLAVVDNSVRALQDAEKTRPRDRWDAEYVVAQTGRDSRALFTWVRDNTLWIPYRGILRGPTGVLMDRQGNSLDRALLLATLLKNAGHAVRLAHAELSDSQALAMLTGTNSTPTSHFRSEAPPPSVSSVRAAAARYNLDASAIEETMRTREGAVAAVASALDARVTDQTRRLVQAVDRRNQRNDWQTRFDRALSARRDHWWVQIDSSGTWSDLDIDAPAGSAGSALTLAQETRQLKEMEKLPLYHEIVVRVITEQLSNGTLTERKAMEHVLRPADAIGKSIVLQFLPSTVVGDSAPPSVQSAIALGSAEQREWTVSLSVNDDVVANAILRANGRDPNAATPGGAFGGLGQAVGAAVSGSGAANGDLSAAWIEYEIRVPGDSPRKIRRTVFDLIGPASRASANSSELTISDAQRTDRAMSLMMRTELLPIACRLSREFVSHLVAESLIRNKDLLRDAAQNFGKPPNEQLNSLVEKSAPLVSSLYSLALARFDWSGDDRYVYVDAPGLLTNHVYPARRDSQTVIRSATDVVANDIGVSLGVRDAFPVRVAHGVFDTNAESSFQMAAAPIDDTGDAFALDNPWVVLNDTSLVSKLKMPDDVRQLIYDDLASGYTVVAPRSPVEMPGQSFAGWWRIDPNTGNTLGIGATGWGNVAGENAVVRSPSRSQLVVQTLKRAGQRAFVAFNTTAGWCVIQEAVEKVGRRGLWVGLKAVVVEDPNQCAYQGLFFGALAAVPLVVIAARIQMGGMGRVSAVSAGVGQQSVGAAAGEAAAESPLAKSVAGPPSRGVSPGESPLANSVGGPPPSSRGPQPAPRPSVPAPPPRDLSAIENDLEAANKDLTDSQNKVDPLMDEYYNKDYGPAKEGGGIAPPMPDATRDAVIEKIDNMARIDALKDEYVNAGGHFGPGGKPAGKYTPLGDIQSLPNSPAPNPSPNPSPMANSAVGFESLSGIK